ncbi:MAG: CapA family protein [Ardenticatenaceae bacterium]|nr:CapA family protein [Ardenticatenaceae bacterium]
MKKTLLPLYLLLAVFLTACIRVSSDGTAVPPTITPIVTTESIIQPTTQPTNDDQQPATSNQQPTTTPQPATSSQQPTTTLPTPQSAASTLPAIPLAMRWRYDAAQPVTAFDLYSLDGGPLPDLLLGSADGRIITLGLQEAEYWRASSPAPIIALLGADLDDDGIGDVIVGREDGRLVILEGSETRWTYEALGPVTAVLLLDDPTTSSLLIAASGMGNLQSVDRNGQQQWRITPGSAPIHALAAADVTGDGTTELIAADDAGTLTALSQSGDVLWQVQTGGAVRQFATPDLNGDGADEIVTGTANGDVIAFSSTGAELWRQNVGAAVPAIATADLNGDGVPELLAGSGSADGTSALVTAFAADGRPLWQSAFGQRGIWALTVGDLDEDGRSDIVLGSDDGQIVVLDDTGAFRAQFAVRGPAQGLRIANIDTSTASPRPELVARAGNALYLLDALGNGTATSDPMPAAPATVPASADFLREGGLLALGSVSLDGRTADSHFLFGADYLLDGVRPLLDTAAITALNLQTPLTLGGETAVKTDLRRADPALLDLLRGVNVTFLANDHILDYGLGGLNDTLEALNEAGIAFTGVGANLSAATAPAIFTIDGQRVAFLAFTGAAPASWAATPTQYGVAVADTAVIAEAVTRAQSEADVVVVALHGSTGAQAGWAHTAVDAGAALVIGYGADTERTEHYGDGYIAYGLGDFTGGEQGSLLHANFADGLAQSPELLRVVNNMTLSSPHLLAGEDGSVARISDFPEGVQGLGGEPIAGVLPQYDLLVDLDYYGHTAVVSQTVVFANDSGDDWDEVVFHAAPAYWGAMFSLQETSVNMDGVPQPVTPNVDNTMLHVPLPQLLAPGEAVAVSFSYTIFLPRLNPTGWSPEGNAGWGPDLLQMGDWYPALISYETGSGWLTWDYWPVGDPTISRLADFDVQIDTAPEVTIAAPGFVVTEGTARRYHMTQARSFAFLASPDYVAYAGNANGIPVQVYVTSGYQYVGLVLVEAVQRALNLFSELYGPYPYDEFVLAENGFLTAMEYSGIVSLSGFAFDAYDDTPESLLIAITAHEVSHQWWYGGVGNDQVNEPWLDESLAMLSELLFYERYYPASVEWWWWYRVDRWEPSGFVDVSIYNFGTSEAFIHNMYGQAAHFVADLRARMGDVAFRSFLQAYYQENGMRFATRDDFFAAVEQFTAVDISDLIAHYFGN